MREEFERLRREGLSVSAISQLTGYDRKTVRKYLQPRVESPDSAGLPKSGKLDPFKPFLEDRLKAGEWNARVLINDLRQRGYVGGYTLLTDWLRPVREAARAAAMRQWETPPGVYACADWGRLCRLELQGRRRLFWCFTLTLAYSRAMCAVAALDQSLPTILHLHEVAFRQLGGIPRHIRYGPLRALWIETAGEAAGAAWNPVFLDFAHHWGFSPELALPHSDKPLPQVPLGVRLVRRNFLRTLPSAANDGLESVNTNLTAWVDQVANQRVFTAADWDVQGRLRVDQGGLTPIGDTTPFPYVARRIRQMAQRA